MRVTSETTVLRSLDRLQARMHAFDRAQTRLGTGRNVQRPSDDPAATRRTMSLRSSMRAQQQQLRNAADGMSWLDTADQQLQAAMTRMQRARELAVRGASTSEPGERAALAHEVRTIRDEIVAIANTQHMGRPLFGGFADGVAVADDGGGWTAQGAGDEIMRRVGDDELVRVNVTAAEWLGFTAGDDLLTRLDGLAVALESGGSSAISGQLADLDTAMSRIGDGLAVVGASASRIESAQARTQQTVDILRAQLSEVEDVDLAEGIMELQTQQVAYEATLQALSRALPPTLAAFLR